MKILNRSLAGLAITAMLLLASPLLTVKATAAPLAITTIALPAGVVGTAYAATMTATGGSGTYTWTIVVPALPPGLTIASNGAITGIPTTAGTFNFFPQVADTTGAVQFAPFTIKIAGAVAPLAISTPATLPGGMVSTAYSQTLAATGGTTPYVWSLATGSSLPVGLSLSTAGVISGTPTTAGTSTFTAAVSDAFLATASQAFSLTISPLTAARSGVLSQVASGGGWRTSIYLVNTSPLSIPITVKFWGNSGAALSLPVTVTQNGVAQVLTGPSVTGTVPSNDTLLIESDTGATTETTGWAEVISTGHITGYGEFHYTSPNGAGSEGTVPLVSEFESSFIVPYDGVGGVDTAVALTNLNLGASASVTATAWGNGGKQLSSQKITVPAGGHTAFLFSTAIPKSVGNRGIVEFTVTGTSIITGLGLRVDPTGGITSIPVLQRP